MMKKVICEVKLPWNKYIPTGVAHYLVEDGVMNQVTHTHRVSSYYCQILYIFLSFIKTFSISELCEKYEEHLRKAKCNTKIKFYIIMLLTIPILTINWSSPLPAFENGGKETIKSYIQILKGF